MTFPIFSVNFAWNSQKQTYLKEYLVLACTSVFITELVLCLADHTECHTLTRKQ
jgi:hypothetical protein